jgi:hypothetical protein
MSRQIYVGLLIGRPGCWFAMVWTSSVGSVTADPLYEIADTYLAFWFGVLRDDVDLIEGGQGAAVLELQRKQIFVPEPADDVRFLFWTGTGAVEPGFPARAYSVADVIDRPRD